MEDYRDATQSHLFFRIEADRVLDFSANYSFTDASGNSWGTVRRKGMKSLWSAHYEIIHDDQVEMTIQEESPMQKLLEGLLGGIPVIGWIAIYLINPSYIIRRPDGETLLRLTKKPAILEGKFQLEKLNDLPEDDELRALLSVIMVGLLERARG